MEIKRLQSSLLVLVLIGVAAWRLRGWKSQPEITQGPKSLHGEQIGDHSAQDKISVKTKASEPKSEMQREAKTWRWLLATPVSFYGRVIDEKKNPIPGANVSASLTDQIYGGHTTLNEITDADGLFHVTGHGLGIVVTVSKEGYYQDDASGGSFTYVDTGGDVNRHTNPNEPATFVLRRKGEGEKLVKRRSVVRFRTDGAPTSIDLADGNLGAVVKATVVVEVWVDDKDIKPNSAQPYGWRCRLSVPGGGVRQRNGEYDFTAPKDGYMPSDEIDMPVSLGARWRRNANKNYFVKFPMDYYARIEFDLIPEGDHFYIITSFLNPKPTSRNLETESE